MSRDAKAILDENRPRGPDQRGIGTAGRVAPERVGPKEAESRNSELGELDDAISEVQLPN